VAADGEAGDGSARDEHPRGNSYEPMQRGCCRAGESAGHDRNRAHELPVLGSLALQFGRDPHDSIFVTDAFFDQ
jgi:hypothetical protein